MAFSITFYYPGFDSAGDHNAFAKRMMPSLPRSLQGLNLDKFRHFGMMLSLVSIADATFATATKPKLNADEVIAAMVTHESAEIRGEGQRMASLLPKADSAWSMEAARWAALRLDDFSMESLRAAHQIFRSV